jgi:hypothetical protein
VPVVEKDGERCSEDFPYEEHGMEVRTTAAGAKKIYVKVSAIRVADSVSDPDPGSGTFLIPGSGILYLFDPWIRDG